jgi:adenine-specific DNA-methyltransferase
MAVNISYMGTKKELAPSVAAVIRQTQRGVMLDAFAGMGTVGEEVAPVRQVWSNDAQLFAAEVGRALFSARDEPRRRDGPASLPS